MRNEELRKGLCFSNSPFPILLGASVSLCERFELMNILEHNLAWLDRKRVQFASSAVQYRRGDTTLTVNGSKAKTDGELTTAEGLTIEASIQDWIITAAELAGLGEPAEGDVIVETLADGRTVTWEVASPGDPEPVFKWQNQARLAYRVHTNEIVNAE